MRFLLWGKKMHCVEKNERNILTFSFGDFVVTETVDTSKFTPEHLELKIWQKEIPT